MVISCERRWSVGRGSRQVLSMRATAIEMRATAIEMRATAIEVPTRGIGAHQGLSNVCQMFVTTSKKKN